MSAPVLNVRSLRMRGARPSEDHQAAAHRLLEQVAAASDLSGLHVSAIVRSVRLRASAREIADGTAAARLARTLRSAVGERP